MPIAQNKVQDLLEKAFPGSQVMVHDLTGTQDHYKVVIVSECFLDKTLIQRHQLVNEALKEPLKGPIHALTIEAYTKDQWTQKVAQMPTPLGIKL